MASRMVNSLTIYGGGRRAGIAIMCLLNVCAWLMAAIAVLGPGRPDAPSVLFPGIAAYALLVTVRTGTVLTEEGVAILRPFGARRISWSDIRNLEVREGRIWGRRVKLTRSNGKVSYLAAPGDSWPVADRDFENNFGIVVDWWTKHRVPYPLGTMPQG